MPREKIKCKIEGCNSLVCSMGKRGGRPKYRTTCKRHKSKRNFDDAEGLKAKEAYKLKRKNASLIN